MRVTAFEALGELAATAEMTSYEPDLSPDERRDLREIARHYRMRQLEALVRMQAARPVIDPSVPVPVTPCWLRLLIGAGLAAIVLLAVLI